MQGASAYIQTINPELLGSISYEHNPAQAVNTYLNSSAGDINKVHEAVVASNDGAPDLQRLAARLQIDKSQISNNNAEVLKTQSFRLAEQPIYGSSRVGVARYWPGQYDAVWNYTTQSKDTIRLLGKQPWYSGTLGGYKPAGITELYAQGVLSTATASHFLGQKQYELSNHLGNVQATLSDKRYVKKQYLSATDSLRKSFAASVSSMYDYYPFGMPMLERSTSDTGTQTAYVSQVVYSPQYTTVNNAMAGASILTMGTLAQPTVNAIVNYYGYNASISKVLTNLVPHMPVTMTINLLYADKTLYIAVAEASVTGTTMLYNASINAGTTTFTFTPTQPSVELSMKSYYIVPPRVTNTSTPLLTFTLDSVNYTQQTGIGSNTQLVQISNKVKGGYRFGFNGQEKDNEIAGEGNEIEFKYRLYDPRIGKFKSADPLHKSYPWNSDYAFAENRVIDGIDLEGLEFYYAADGTVLRKNGDNIQVMLVNNDFVSKTAYASIEQLNKNSTNIGMTNYELNARAFLTMIRKGEGTLGLNGYKAQFAGKQFNDFSDHPNLVVNSGKYSSSASGAYQVLSKTWNSKAGENAKKDLGIKDFSPESQDKFGLWLISNRNALGDVIDGNVRGAIGKTNKEWASLPGSPYGQPTQTLEGALQNFKGAVSKELNGKSEIATPKGDLEKTIKTLKK